MEEALARRRSVRSFSSEPLSDGEIGQLLWAAQGITAEGGRRAAPSAGALYPLELGAVPIGAFVDSEVARILGLPTDETPIYLLPAGRVG